MEAINDHDHNGIGYKSRNETQQGECDDHIRSVKDNRETSKCAFTAVWLILVAGVPDVNSQHEEYDSYQNENPLDDLGGNAELAWP